jgi:hypothetical protein
MSKRNINYLILGVILVFIVVVASVFGLISYLNKQKTVTQPPTIDENKEGAPTPKQVEVEDEQQKEKNQQPPAANADGTKAPQVGMPITEGQPTYPIPISGPEGF